MRYSPQYTPIAAAFFNSSRLVEISGDRPAGGTIATGLRRQAAQGVERHLAADREMAGRGMLQRSMDPFGVISLTSRAHTDFLPKPSRSSKRWLTARVILFDSMSVRQSDF